MSNTPYNPNDPKSMRAYILALEKKLGIKSEVVHVFEGDVPDFPKDVKHIVVHAPLPAQVQFAGRSITFYCGHSQFRLDIREAFASVLTVDFGAER